ncbi:MAG: SsrA-binding protein SmpB [Deltaproteobacteria bacterium]|nr:SsrA-binding protein SmpB [Deltaproteobacteria bacterium]
MFVSILIIQDNKKARFDYEILETYEAGIVLTGSEVKSLRDKSVQLKDSYISFIKDEAYLQNAHISPYKASSYNNHSPERLRKLLLHKEELQKIFGKIKEKGLSCVPLKIFFKKGLVKLDIALVRGKKLHDKRETIKNRDAAKRLKNDLRT